MLEQAFAERDCDHWLTELGAADIACHQVLSMNDIFAQYTRHVNCEGADETAAATTEILKFKDPNSSLTVSRLAPNYVRVGEQQSWKRLAVDPKHGQHTVEVLKDLGYSKGEIADLIRLKVSHECSAETLSY